MKTGSELKIYRRFRPMYLLSLVLLASGSLMSGCSKQSDDTPEVKFTKGPYLIYPGNNTQMKVLWETDLTPFTSKISWGTTESCGDSAITVSSESYSEDQMHGFNYVITGLIPGTKIYYKVIADQNIATGSFYASPASNATHLTFYGIGDSQPKTGTPAMFDAVSASLLNDMNLDAATRHTLLLHGGDFVYRGRVEGDWANGYFNNNYSNIKTLVAEMPIMGAVGNHEFYDQNGKLDNTHPNAFIDQYLSLIHI